ncbi:hypothetical protein [Salinibacter ruber]|nr:hypothetical protein [Salinibacter ruber]MCS4116328.1 hypothetical protein [Salinibacter ruber]
MCTEKQAPSQPYRSMFLDRLLKPWLYDKISGTPALGSSRERVFFDVYGLAVERLLDAERAVEAARHEFYRGDHPFDYEISESAPTVGGQSA